VRRNRSFIQDGGGQVLGEAGFFVSYMRFMGRALAIAEFSYSNQAIRAAYEARVFKIFELSYQEVCGAVLCYISLRAPLPVTRFWSETRASRTASCAYRRRGQVLTSAVLSCHVWQWRTAYWSMVVYSAVVHVLATAALYWQHDQYRWWRGIRKRAGRVWAAVAGKRREDRSAVVGQVGWMVGVGAGFSGNDDDDDDCCCGGGATSGDGSGGVDHAD
jgi:hypothetical protein